MDQRNDYVTRERLAEIQDGFVRHGRRTTRILTALFVVQLPLAVLSIYLLGQNSDRVDEIQRSRVNIIHSSCVEQNQRHDRTIDRYDEGFDDAVRSGRFSGRELDEANERRKFTIGLIEALAPQRDCVALIRDRFGEGGVPLIERRARGAVGATGPTGPTGP